MPRQRAQEPEDAPYVPVVSEALERARERTATHRAALAVAEQEEQQKEREAREAVAREAERLAKVAEAQVPAQRVLDAAYARITSVLPLFGLDEDVQAAMRQYAETVTPLGERFPEQLFNRHPVAQFLPLLKMFRRPAD